MILTAHQPVYLPWLGLFHKISLADKFCFFDDVQYQPKDWNNRNKIKFNNGTSGWLTVPVLRKSYLERSYLEIEINNQLPWQRKHWKSIELNYREASYFGLYEKELKKFYEVKWQFLSELNYEMLLFFLEKLNISILVVRMKDYDFKGHKSELVLDMCRQLGADIYIFGEKGKDYADVEGFHAAGITPLFQDYRHPTYPQMHGEFIPYLSIIDLLFNCGSESLSILTANNLRRSDLFEHSIKL
jgi:hypothetical protein